MRIRVLVMIVLLVCSLAVPGYAQDNSTAPQAAPVPAPAPAEPPPTAEPVEPSAAVEPQPVEAPPVAQPVEEEPSVSIDSQTPLSEEAPVVEDVPEIVEEKAGPKATILLATRTAPSILTNFGDADFAMEYGFDLSFQSKDVGVVIHWAAIVFTPDTVDFSYKFGFAFHYYPFGDGPSGLYTGPGFSLWHIDRDSDPIQAAVAPQLYEGKVQLYYFKSGNQPYDLLGPMWVLGYRYVHDVGFMAGVDFRIGAAFSDRLEYYPHAMYVSLNPSIGWSF